MANTASTTSSNPLRVLVVEDEALIGIMFEDALKELGCEVVKICTTLAQAIDSAANLELDVAILDFNLRGEQSIAVGQILRDRGIPFVFSTGYGSDSVPQDFRNQILLAKPFGDDDIKTALESAMNGRWTFLRPASDAASSI